jgi:hypothetical protein
VPPEEKKDPQVITLLGIITDFCLLLLVGVAQNMSLLLPVGC